MTTTAPAPGVALDPFGMPLERASALPPSYYIDPQILRVEEEVIFRRSWIPIGRIDQVANAGDYFSYNVAGTPIVVARDKTGELRALSAACLHRFMPVVEDAGNRTSFQCPYHLWTYGLDGQLIGAPEMERAAGFNKSDCRLPEVRLEVWEGFIFVNLDADAEPLAPQVEPLRKLAQEYRMGDMRTAAILEYPEAEWNWKITVENGVESYHHMGTHRDTLEPFFPARTTSHDDSDGPWIYHRLPFLNGQKLRSRFAVPDDLRDDQWRELVVISVFPTLLVALQPDEMNWLQIVPGKEPGRHSSRWWICFRPDAFADPQYEAHLAESKATLDAVHQQDLDACAAVWRGVTSQYAQAGRLSHLEKGVWQFDEWVRARIASAS
jgi:phenylpropionate dioxygenase-like ring-hydroxylating dioxygenase large terminal subunit